MARLSKHGPQLIQLTKPPATLPSGNVCHTTLSIHLNGDTLIRRIIVRPDGTRQNDGWKMWDRKSASNVAAAFDQARLDALVAKGWTIDADARDMWADHARKLHGDDVTG